jgi:hypothetical protein
MYESDIHNYNLTMITELLNLKPLKPLSWTCRVKPDAREPPTTTAVKVPAVGSLLIRGKLLVVKNPM